jgi:hypothetical protein
VEHCVLRSHLALLRSPYVWSDLRRWLPRWLTIGSGSPADLRYQPPSHLKKQSRLALAPLPRRELPCFSEQEKTRDFNHLSA